MDKKLGQELQGLQEVLGALEAKVKEVTLFVDKTGVPPSTEVEEEA